MGFMSEETVELQESGPSLEEEINHSLELTAEYLASRIKNSREEDPDLDYQMRLTGAKIQGRVVALILGDVGDELFIRHSGSPQARKRREMKKRLNGFWQGYQSLVVRKCVEVLEEAGFERSGLPSSVVKEEVLGCMRGVRGVTAVALMGKGNGWQVELPTPEEDVKEGIDLKLKRGDQSVPLQVKCRAEGRLMVTKKGSLIWVEVPGQEDFYYDQMVGIPEKRYFHQFGKYFDQQLEKGGE